MVLQKYSYEDRYPILTIPKCGTRFVRNSNYINMEEVGIDFDTYIDGMIDSNCTITYRSPRQHIISAIQTDYVWGNYYGRKQHEIDKERKWDLNKIVDNMINDNSDHWSPNLYKNLYRIWNKTDFKILHLSKLSEQFDYKIDYKPEFYDSHDMPNFKSKDEILSLIPNDKLEELYKLCDEDEVWLNRILNGEKGIAIWDDVVRSNKTIEELNEKIYYYQNIIKSMEREKIELLDYIQYIGGYRKEKTKLI